MLLIYQSVYGLKFSIVTETIRLWKQTASAWRMSWRVRTSGWSRKEPVEVVCRFKVALLCRFPGAFPTGKRPHPPVDPQLAQKLERLQAVLGWRMSGTPLSFFHCDLTLWKTMNIPNPQLQTCLQAFIFDGFTFRSFHRKQPSDDWMNSLSDSVPQVHLGLMTLDVQPPVQLSTEWVSCRPMKRNVYRPFAVDTSNTFVPIRTRIESQQLIFNHYRSRTIDQGNEAVAAECVWVCVCVCVCDCEWFIETIWPEKRGGWLSHGCWVFPAFNYGSFYCTYKSPFIILYRHKANTHTEMLFSCSFSPAWLFSAPQPIIVPKKLLQHNESYLLKPLQVFVFHPSLRVETSVRTGVFSLPLLRQTGTVGLMEGYRRSLFNFFSSGLI